MTGGDSSSTTNTADGGDISKTIKNETTVEVSAGDGGGVVDGFTINVRCSNGSKFSVKVENLELSVGSFKSVLAQNCEIPAEQQRLIYKGRILKDDQTLISYGLEADHTVHMVRGFAPAPAANTTPVPAANTTPAANTRPANTNPGVPRDAGSDEGAAFGGSGLGSLFPGLGLNGLGSGGGGLLGAGLPNLEQMQQQFTQNPNMMRDILDTPVVQNIMNNPDIIRNLIMNNPQMREVMDRNPELAHILNDPATLRQTMEAARNPEIMREMMRNTDRAMSNIESSPEGFNMLRRMYENVQEPFLNATTMAGENRGAGSGTNPFAALFGAQGGAPGRDQSANPTTASADSNPPAPNTNPLPNPWASTGTGAAQTNTTARSTPAGDTRPPPIAGLGGLGLPELEGMLGNMPDPNSLNQMMQNPAISQMLQSFLSNPQYLNQIIGFNPQLRSMLDSNPQVRERLRNPEFIRQLTSPETMQQFMQLATLQQSLVPQLGRQQTAQEPGQNAGVAAPGSMDNMGMEMLMNMLGGLGGGLGTVPNTPNVPPEELYATQLSQLQEMGFFDAQENLRALIATNGNVHAAVERLLGNLGWERSN